MSVMLYTPQELANVASALRDGTKISPRILEYLATISYANTAAYNHTYNEHVPPVTQEMIGKALATASPLLTAKSVAPVVAGFLYNCTANDGTDYAMPDVLAAVARLASRLLADLAY